MKIGVIGGSGLYALEDVGILEEVAVDTPFGKPSDVYMHGTVGGHDVYFLPRHGRGHTILPSELNHRANIYGMKLLGVERVISVTAVGSLRQDVRPRDIMLPDQFFDRTKKSMEHTFFGDGLVAHVAFGEPTCAEWRGCIAESIERVLSAEAPRRDLRVFDGGTYVNMEGPAFSTKAESRVYRKMGFDIIGMTALGEAKLCREAEICYQSMAMITDYDCWHEDEEGVTAESVGAHLAANTAIAKKILSDLLLHIPQERKCACGDSLSCAIMTKLQTVPVPTIQKLKPLIEKYM